ncbi:EmrB/QacA subfamily drug resistance transporter [Kitasatospora sp. MAA4]|uniref:MFS transporter n=1 Tax=Kitasatospora sp. MAA4 TaxID=3035093 RepID=UPI002474B85E|nr:MFS transporter [Kitasatospora sp. MAA4]MDH6135468.1 EmrB/QacA subfamily drug resistance transporter [Kitasatospora sp. MAA4]
MTTSTSPGTSSGATTPQAAAPSAPHWAALPIVLVGVFLSGLDFFIVNVAIPSMQADLHASEAQIQLIVASYALMYGVGMITGGRLGDLFGRRRMFALAMTIFTIASAACGLAPNPGALLAFRMVQGASAALMAPQVLAIFTTVYIGEARARAINWYGATSGFAAVFGQLIGGILIKTNVFHLEWRGCFLINLPIGLAAAALALKYVPESKAPGRPKLDLVGMILVTLALAAVCVPLIEGRQQGWPLWSWICLVAAVPLFVIFARQQNRVRASGAAPSVDFSLFRERAFTAGLVAQLTFWTSMASYFLVLALYLQKGRGLEPLNSGLVFGGLGLGYIITSLTARFVAAKLGRQTIALGCAIRIVALILQIVTVTQIGTTGNIIWLVPGLFLDGAGMGLAVAPLASTVLSRVTPKNAGSAAGVLTTGLQVGNGLGVALIGLIFYNVLAHTTGADAYPHAFTACLYYVLGISVLLGLVVQALPKTPGAK